MKISVWDKGRSMAELRIEGGCAKDVYKEFKRQGKATIKWAKSTGLFNKLYKYYVAEYPNRYEKATKKDMNQINKMTLNWGKAVKPEKMQEVLYKWYLVSGTHAGQLALEDMKVPKPLFNLRNPEMLAGFAERGAKITGNITATTLKNFRNRLAKTYAETGMSPYAVEKEIRGMFAETYKNRSMTIARTETRIAQSTVKHQTYERNGIQKKKWSATKDDKVRDTHSSANGQVRDTNKAFNVGGFAMMFDHDPIAPAKEVVNCRCTTQYFTDLRNFKPVKVWEGGADGVVRNVSTGLPAVQAKEFANRYKTLGAMVNLPKMGTNQIKTVQAMIDAGRITSAMNYLGKHAGLKASTLKKTGGYSTLKKDYRKCTGQ